MNVSISKLYEPYMCIIIINVTAYMEQAMGCPSLESGLLANSVDQNIFALNNDNKMLGISLDLLRAFEAVNHKVSCIIMGSGWCTCMDSELYVISQ